MLKIIAWIKSLFSPPKLQVELLPRKAYIDYSNDYIVPVPGKADDTMMYCFPMKGKYENLQKVIDQRLNFSPLNEKVRFFPLSDFIMLVMSDIKKGYSLDKSYEKYGYLEEKALQIFVPIVECTLNKNQQWVAQRILFHIPYIFVDQPFNLSIGREEFGFSKSFAKFNFPDSPDTAELFEVNPYGFKNYNKENPEWGAYHSLVNIKKINGNKPDGKWENSDEAWKHIYKHINPNEQEKQFKEGLPFLLHELKDFAHKTIPLIFLKQFRDIINPEMACYQAITEGDGINAAFHGGWFLGSEYSINFESMASYPIMQDLGLPSSVIVNHPFWIHSDLQFNAGNVYWENK